LDIEENLEKLQIVLPKVATPLGSYRPCVVSGNYIYVSGQLPIKEGELLYKGKVGEDLSLEEAIEAARICAINSLAILKNETLDLNKIKKIVKVTGYVASSENFYKQADVINGASNLYFEVFGEKGVHARAAVGVYQLPINSPVEVDLIAEYIP
jgi:enamine deaminase RidA (YjgF/YER057c/UK114 family)